MQLPLGLLGRRACLQLTCCCPAPSCHAQVATAYTRTYLRQSHCRLPHRRQLRSQRRCFETFPHAITVHLHRAFGLEPVLAARKREQRRALLAR